MDVVTTNSLSLRLSLTNADGLKRKPNFSLDEKLFLINYIKEHKSIHDKIDPYSGDVTKSLSGWSEIASAFVHHFPGKTSRDPNDLRSCWKRIRDKARCIYAPHSGAGTPYKQLTKPKWLEKKKPVPNIVSKLAWEFMVLQECSQLPLSEMSYQGYVDMMKKENDEWSLLSELSSTQDHDACSSGSSSPELLILEEDESSGLVESRNDVIRIKKEWIAEEDRSVTEVISDIDEMVTQEYSDTLHVESPSTHEHSVSRQLSLPSSGKKEAVPKVMMVESLQSETHRNLETAMSVDTAHHAIIQHPPGLGVPKHIHIDSDNLEPIKSTRINDVEEASTKSCRPDSGELHEVPSRPYQQGSKECATRLFAENNAYLGHRAYREESSKSTTSNRHFDAELGHTSSREGAVEVGNQYLTENTGHKALRVQTAKVTQVREDNADLAHTSSRQNNMDVENRHFTENNTYPGHRSCREGPKKRQSGEGSEDMRQQASQNHAELGYRADVDSQHGQYMIARQENIMASTNAAEDDRRDVSSARYHDNIQTHKNMNEFDTSNMQQQALISRSLKHRRTRRFISSKRQQVLNTHQTPPERVNQEVNPGKARSHSEGHLYDHSQETAWKSRNNTQTPESEVQRFESTSIVNERNYQHQRPMSNVYRNLAPPRSPIHEPAPKRRYGNNFADDVEATALEMAQEEHNIKMQIHRRKLRILILEEWALEQECHQAGFDLPPDYH